MTRGLEAHMRARAALVCLAITACALPAASLDGEAAPRQTAPTAMSRLIPKPLSVAPTGKTFALAPDASILVDGNAPELRRVGEYLAERLRPATGFDLPVRRTGGEAPRGSVRLTTAGADRSLGDEGYVLTITSNAVVLAAPRPAGLVRGIQTLRQLLPGEIESPRARAGPWTIPTGTIRDRPRFAWRGAMLDVARHFFGVADVKRFIDLIAAYKLNVLHLHLSDDQGWRIEIKSWPRLAKVGGRTEIGGGAGGYFTQQQYAELVRYAARRHVTVVPEIDVPGHTNAALASYAELNCDGVARPAYSGGQVGFSSLCIDKEITYEFLDDVFGELARLTPGQYLHVGGDEASATAPDDYVRFVERVQKIVQSHGKRMIGWEEIARVRLDRRSIAQHWKDEVARLAVEKGASVIMSPSTRAYLDMKYTRSTALGLEWAGHTEVRDAYAWDPATQLAGVGEDDVLGVEAPLWSETLKTIDDVEFMLFPRLPGIAEIGWSAKGGRGWSEYRSRLAAHGPRLEAMGVDFYRSPQVPWAKRAARP